MKLPSALAAAAAASAPLLTSACLLPEERTGSASRLVGRRQASGDNGIPVGSGDRFRGGTVVPRGLGTRPAGTSYSSLLSVQEIESGFQALATTYGFETFDAPFKTYEGRTVFGGRIGGANGTCSDAYRVFINAAIHARERGASDGLLYFVSDLLYADKNNVGVTYGRKSYTAADVKKALSAGLVFIPLSNPDGVAYDQASNSCWRKNRNPKSSSKGVPDSIGVDLNRNFDFLWDFEKTFAPSASSSVASTNPSDETFHGELLSTHNTSVPVILLPPSLTRHCFFPWQKKRHQPLLGARDPEPQVGSGHVLQGSLVHRPALLHRRRSFQLGLRHQPG